MAVTQAQLDALVDAYATGALRVTYDGKTIEYRSMDDLASAISRVSAALGLANPLAPAASAPSRTSYAAFRRG